MNYLKGKGFDVEVVHNNKYKATKIKCYIEENETYFLEDGSPLEKSQSLAYSLILIDSI